MDVWQQLLEKETPIHLAKIRDLYHKLDRRTGLDSSRIPIEFGYDQDVLGAYQNHTQNQKERFYFSLLFIGYGVPKPLTREDREDLFRHEYAHFMQYNMEIPVKYQWQPGIHGSAWKYCCSLVDAVPTPYYKAGEALMKHDYDKVLKNPIHDQSVPIRDVYQRERVYQQKKNAEVKFKIGDRIIHPKYKEGTIEQIQSSDRSVTLSVRFGDERKNIDQSWLLKTIRQKKSVLR